TSDWSAQAFHSSFNFQKLAHCMVRNNASEARDGTLAVPYYRMHLRPARHSDQHEMLLDLERTGNERAHGGLQRREVEAAVLLLPRVDDGDQGLGPQLGWKSSLLRWTHRAFPSVWADVIDAD